MTRNRLASLGAAALLAGLLAPAGAAHAASSPTVTLTTLHLRTAVTSSTGKRLDLTLDVSKAPGQSTSAVVTLATPTGGESHVWAFTLPRRVERISTTGSGVVKATRSELHGFGTLVIHTSPLGTTRTHDCAAGVPSSAKRSVALTGRLHFLTKSSGAHPWGRVGSARHAFSFQRGKVSWTYDQSSCPAPPNPPCTTGTTWRAVQFTSGGGLVSLSGSRSGSSYVLSGNRFVRVPHTSGQVFRNDLVRRTTGSWTVTSQPDGNVTVDIASPLGSASIVSSSYFDMSTACGSASSTMATRTFTGAYTNGSTALHLPAQVFGALTVADGATGGHVTQKTVTP